MGVNISRSAEIDTVENDVVEFHLARYKFGYAEIIIKSEYDEIWRGEVKREDLVRLMTALITVNEL